MKRCSARPKLASGIPSEILNRYLPKIDFGKSHGTSAGGWFGISIYIIHEYTHPLFSCAVSINSPAWFSCSFNFYSIRSSFNCIIRVNALNDKIRMPIEISVFSESTGVFCETGSEHVGQNTRHYSRAKHIIKALKSFFGKEIVYIIEEIIHVLHCHLEIRKSKFIGQFSIFIETCCIDDIPLY